MSPCTSLRPVCRFLICPVNAMYQENQLHRSRNVSMRMAFSRAHIYAKVVDVVNLILLIKQSGNTSPMRSTLRGLSRLPPNHLGCASGCVVECRICNREVVGSNLSLGYLAPRSTQPSIPPGSVNEYQLRLGRQRQVWLLPIADERVGVQVKL